MKLADVKESYSYHTSTLSGIVRQLAFAGLALIWIFRQEIDGQSVIPKILVYASVLILICLLFDILHYLAGSLIWGRYFRKLDQNETGPDVEFKPDRRINWPTLFFFGGKVALLFIAYALLLKFLSDKIKVV